MAENNQIPDENAGEPQTPQRPDNVPEKFWNSEHGSLNTDALLKSYSESQKALTRANQSKSENQQEPDADNGLQIQRQPNAEASIDQILASANLTQQELSGQWQGNGTLTDDQYASLGRVGYPRSMVDMYLQGQQAQTQLAEVASQQAQSRASEMAGGEDQLNTLLSWAGQNLPEHRITDINERLQDPKRFEGAVREVIAEHRESVGAGTASPLVTNGSVGASNAGAAISNRQEFRNLMARARSGDPAARRQLASVPHETMARMV